MVLSFLSFQAHIKAVGQVDASLHYTMKTAVSCMDPKIRSIKDNLGTKFDFLAKTLGCIERGMCVCACRGQGYLQAASGEESADMLHSGNGTFRHMGHLLHMPAHIFVRLGRYPYTPDCLVC